MVGRLRSVMPGRWGLGWQITLLVALVVVPATGLLVYGALNQRWQAEREAEQSATALAMLFANQHGEVLAETRGLLETIMAVPDVALASPTNCQLALARILERYDRLANLGLADANGDVVCSALPLQQPVNIADRAYFRQSVATSGFSVGEYQIGRITGKPGLNVGLPIRVDDRVDGVAYAAIDLTSLGTELSLAGLPEGSVVNLVDSQGLLLVRAPDPEGLAGTRLNDEIVARLIGGDHSPFRARGVDGTSRLYSIAKLGTGTSGSAYVMVGLPTSAVFGPANRATLLSLTLMMAVGVVSLGGAWVFARRYMIGPIGSLNGVAKRLAAGSYDVTDDLPRSGGEVGQLSSSIARMVQAIQSRETALAESRDRISSILEAAQEGIYEIDAQGVVKYINPAGARLLGWSADDLIGRRMHEATHHSRPDGTPLPPGECRISATLRHGTVREVEEDTFWTKDGRPLPVRYVGSPTGTAGGRPGGAVVVFSDATERNRLDQELRRLSMTDLITGMPNRQAFGVALDQALRLALAAKSRGAIIHIDLDNFKYINDAYGHSAGDELVKAVADSLVVSAPPGSMVARWSGDEYAVLLPETSHPDALRLAREFVGVVSKTVITVRTDKVSVTASAGVVVFPIEGASVDDLSVFGDIAVHRAKMAGRNRAELFDPASGTRAEMTSRQRAREMILDALKTNRLRLQYQPIFRLDTRQPAMFEALCRIAGEDGKLVGPASFIPQAEELDLITAIDQQVAMLGFAKMRELAIRGRQVSLALNVSGKSTGDETARFLIREARQADIDPRRVVIEVTETAIQRSGPTASRFLAYLKEAGFGLALDDYGSGSTSFGELRSGRFNHIKLDGGVVRDLATNQANRKFVRSITEIASTSGIAVVAEFIQDEATVEYLTQIGINLGQGYYLGKPVDDI